MKFYGQFEPLVDQQQLKDSSRATRSPSPKGYQRFGRGAINRKHVVVGLRDRQIAGMPRDVVHAKQWVELQERLADRYRNHAGSPMAESR